MPLGTRYDLSRCAEEEYEPGSRGRVLKNLLGIRHKGVLDELQGHALVQALRELATHYTPASRFRAGDIRRMHHAYLGRIYPWAGAYRTVNLSRRGFLFADVDRVGDLMREFERGPLRRHTPCRFRSMARVLDALAEVHVELILIHPFREGNGRTARILSTLMALQAGLPLLNFGWWATPRGRRAYLAAIHDGVRGDYAPMRQCFGRVLRDSF